MTKAIGIAVAFVAIALILYMGLAMVSSIPEPEAGSDEYDEFENLSKIIDISYKGYYVVLLIIVILAIITSLKIGGKI